MLRDSFFTSEDNSRGAIADSGSVGGGDGAAFLKDGWKLCHGLYRRVGTSVLVNFETRRACKIRAEISIRVAAIIKCFVHHIEHWRF